MYRWKKLLVWLKRRRNPPKQDGGRTVSFTLQWRDEDYKERFESLGADITEEEAEAKRLEFAEFLNGNHGGHPQQFIEMMSKRNQRAMEQIRLVVGNDPRQWPFQEMFGDVPEKWQDRFDYLLLTLQSRPTDDAKTLLQQFKAQQPAEYEVLVDILESKDALEKTFRTLLLFHNSETVWATMFHHAKDWEWSSDPSRFVEQFRSRYPAEFQKIEEDFSLESQVKVATSPPKEVARNLRDHVRGVLKVSSNDDDVSLPGKSIVLRSQI